MQLPDPGRSRAVLIGVAEYQELPQLPAVRNNISRLRELFTDPTVLGLPNAHCAALLNPDDQNKVLGAIHDAATNATDTLLIYYAGHGLLEGESMDLRLPMPQLDAERMYMSVRYAEVRDILRRSPNDLAKVVVLDCCYSGSALKDGMGLPAEVADDVAVDGSWVVTASAHNARALAPPGETYTAFSGELIKLLETGVNNGQDFLDVNTLYFRIRQQLKAKSRPEPQQRIRNEGSRIVIARNRWTARTGERQKVNLSPDADPYPLSGVPTSLEDLQVWLAGLRQERNDDAVRALRAVGQYRSSQETASILDAFDRTGRSADVAAVLGGVVLRDVGEVLEILEVLAELEAVRVVAATLATEGAGPPDRTAQLTALLHRSPETRPLVENLLSAAVESSEAQPSRIIDIVTNLHLWQMAEAADHVLHLYGASMDAHSAAVIADALREGGRETAAFNLYPQAQDELAGRAPEQVAALVVGLRHHQMETFAASLVAAAARKRSTADERADLLMALAHAHGLEDEFTKAIEAFASELDGREVDDLGQALVRRDGDPVSLYVAALDHRPVSMTAEFVAHLIESCRPRDALGLLKRAALRRSAADLEVLTRTIADTPGHKRSRSVFGLVSAKRPDCFAELYATFLASGDDRLEVLRSELLTLGADEILHSVVTLTREAAPGTGSHLLQFALDREDALTADTVARWAELTTVDLLLLAAAGLDGHELLVRDLARRRLDKHGAIDFDVLLMSQPTATIAKAVKAFALINRAAHRDSLARWFAGLPVNHLLKIIEVIDKGRLTERQTDGTVDNISRDLLWRVMENAGGQKLPDTARLIVSLANSDSAELLTPLMQSWNRRRQPRPDRVILASMLDRLGFVSLGESLLSRRLAARPPTIVNPFIMAVCDIVLGSTVPYALTTRYPETNRHLAGLRRSGILEEGDACLLILEYQQSPIKKHRIVFTDWYAQHWSGGAITYLGLARSQGVDHRDRNVWVVNDDGEPLSTPWAMGSAEEVEGIVRLLTAIRQALVIVRHRYRDVLGQVPELGAALQRRQLTSAS
jgi:hypothetical protein